MATLAGPLSPTWGQRPLPTESLEAEGRHAIREADRVLASDASILDALALALTRSPVPRQNEDIADELVAAGLDLGADPEERLQRATQRDARFSQVGDGMVFIPALLEGTCWTIAVDAENAREDLVRLDVDLAILTWWLIADEVSLVDDEGLELGTLRVEGIDLDGADTDVVFGPPGWLEPFAGGLASVEIVDGALRWSACSDEPSATARQVDATRAGFDLASKTESYGDVIADEPVELTFAMGEQATMESLVADRGAFIDDQPPRHGTLLEAAGLESRGPFVAPAGFDWERLSTWQGRNRSMWEFDLDDDEAAFLAMLGGAAGVILAGEPDALGDDAEQRAAGAALLASILEQHEDVAVAFWASHSASIPSDEILRFADALVDALGEATPGVAWLRSRCLDAMGRVPEAIGALDEVVSDTDHPLVLLEAAGFAADRGDAPTARRLLERAGTLDHLAEHDGEFTHSSPDLDLLAEVLPFAQRPKAMARRNDPCPCGSGRKYKACHLGEEQHPLDMRAAWLYGKAVRHLHRTDPLSAVEIAREMARHVGWETEQELMDSPAAVDLALLEGGACAVFLAARSDLLPADEALLAAQWTLVDR
ncbi:MAG: SEC-C domain-containing protein, partial [Acidimicrobiia bacterium]|nr:SEC-C domain-containing protein [Acidimicrobiia bacterium]